MQCPYCQSPVGEESPACPRCGLTMQKAGAFFGVVPRLPGGVCDSAGVLRGSDVRSIRRGIAGFEKRFPQCGFTAAFMALGKDVPGAAYTFWLFNRANPGGESDQGRLNRRVLLLVDTAGRGAWITLGYGLEPFISRKKLENCLETAQAHFAAGRWGAGVSMLLAGLESTFLETVTAFPRVYGLPPLRGGERGKTGIPAATR